MLGPGVIIFVTIKLKLLFKYYFDFVVLIKMAASKGNRLGAWTFLIGAIVALVFGAFGSMTLGVAWLLVVVGLVAGFLNIADEETKPFLMSGAVLIIASALGQQALEIIPMFANILNALLLIFVPATVIVAIRNVFGMARH